VRAGFLGEYTIHPARDWIPTRPDGGSGDAGEPPERAFPAQFGGPEQREGRPPRDDIEVVRESRRPTPSLGPRGDSPKRAAAGGSARGVLEREGGALDDGLALESLADQGVLGRRHPTIAIPRRGALLDRPPCHVDHRSEHSARHAHDGITRLDAPPRGPPGAQVAWPVSTRGELDLRGFEARGRRHQAGEVDEHVEGEALRRRHAGGWRWKSDHVDWKPTID